MIKSIMTPNLYTGGGKTIGKKAPKYRLVGKALGDVCFHFLLFNFSYYDVYDLSLKILVLKHFKILIIHDLTAQ